MIEAMPDAWSGAVSVLMLPTARAARLHKLDDHGETRNAINADDAADMTLHAITF
ncbi:MAG: hypothetical protein ABL907_25625 [Hyphomicrobium sp.]